MSFFRAIHNMKTSKVSTRPMPIGPSFFGGRDVLQRGWNGETEFTSHGVGDELYALSEKLFRPLPIDRLLSYIDEVRAKAIADSDVECLINLFILTFQTRWVRGGKKEKALPCRVLLYLYEFYPQTVMTSIEFLPTVGYFKDWLHLLTEYQQMKKTGWLYSSGRPHSNSFRELFNLIATLFARQLKLDEVERRVYCVHRSREKAQMASILGGPDIFEMVTLYAPFEMKQTFYRFKASLAAKYAPSPGKHHDNRIYILDERRELPRKIGLSEQVARLIFPNVWKRPKLMGKYRKLLSNIREELGIVETNMCDGRWSEIRFTGHKKIPSIALERYKDAILNRTKDTPLTPELRATGNRFPNNPDRVECMKHATRTFRSGGKVSGKDMDLAQLTRLALHCDKDSVDYHLVNAQYQAMLKHLRKMIKKGNIEHGTESDDNPRPIIAMCDTSGSMDGMPLEFSIGASLIIDDLNPPEWKGRIMTFSSTPEWHALPSTSFVDRAQSLSTASWKQSTNLWKAMHLIIDTIGRKRLPKSKCPRMIVIFSDMQWDTARGHTCEWSTMHEKIVARFRESVGQDPPILAYWNVNSTTTGHPVSYDQKGVVTISGRSEQLARHLICGSLTEEITPKMLFGVQLYEEFWDDIRARLAKHMKELSQGFQKSTPSLASPLPPPIESSRSWADVVRHGSLPGV